MNSTLPITLPEPFHLPYQRPMWIRPPAARQHCRWFGLTPSYYRHLAQRGEIRTLRLLRPGKTRGLRLYHYDSIATYIRRSAELPERAAPIWPEFIRIPAEPHHCPWFGISVAWYYHLIREKKIRSHQLRQRGRLTGPRVIDFHSVAQYLETVFAEQRPDTAL